MKTAVAVLLKEDAEQKGGWMPVLDAEHFPKWKSVFIDSLMGIIIWCLHLVALQLSHDFPPLWEFNFRCVSLSIFGLKL